MPLQTVRPKPVYGLWERTIVTSSYVYKIRHSKTRVYKIRQSKTRVTKVGFGDDKVVRICSMFIIILHHVRACIGNVKGKGTLRIYIS